MYEYLRGLITYVSPIYVVLEINGIGYQIQSANPFRYEEGKEATIYVQQVIREDAHLLYGFYNLEEKNLFLRLISVSGIGPKSALAILAGNDHLGLQDAIAREDVKYLTRFPGVGKKTAQQMILDLKGKLDVVTGDLFHPAKEEKKALKEALAALKALGYGEKEVNKLEDTLSQEDLTTEEFISKGLKLLMKK